MDVDSEYLEQLLNNYVSVSNHINDSFICDYSGKILSCASQNSIHENQYYKNLCEIGLSALEQAQNQSNGQNFSTGIFKTDKNRVLFNAAGSTALLFAVFDFNISVNYVLTYSFMVAEKIKHIIEKDVFEGFNIDVPKFKIKRIMPAASLENFQKQNSEIDHKDGSKKVSFLTHSKRDMLYKFILLGDPAVGKTSLINKYTYGRFRDDYIPTLGISITEHNYVISGLGNSTIKLLFWDLAGQENFSYARRIYIDGAHAGFLVYSVTDKDSYKNIKKWHNAVIEDVGNIPLILVANKIDLHKERVISKKDGLKLADKMGCSYMETSAKTGENVKDAFQVLGLGLFFKE